jgi:hypothetical protein
LEKRHLQSLYPVSPFILHGPVHSPTAYWTSPHSVMQDSSQSF